MTGVLYDDFTKILQHVPGYLDISTVQLVCAPRYMYECTSVSPADTVSIQSLQQRVNHTRHTLSNIHELFRFIS